MASRPSHIYMSTLHRRDRRWHTRRRRRSVTQSALRVLPALAAAGAALGVALERLVA